MSHCRIPLGLIIAALLAAWAAAQGSAQPPEGAPKKAEGAQPAPKGLTPPPGLTPESFTAFPDLKFPCGKCLDRRTQTAPTGWCRTQTGSSSA